MPGEHAGDVTSPPSYKEPVGKAIMLPDHDEDPVRRALVAIDTVHSDGNLPAARVLYEDMEELGSFDVLATGEPVIRLSDRMVQTEFTTVHEVGHYVARFSLGDGVRDPNLDSRNTTLMEFQRLAAQTRAVGKIERLCFADEDDIAAFALWRQPDIFARAYAQYVTVKSGDLVLWQQLDACLKRRVDRNGRKVYYPEQWDEDDFMPLAEWFDAEFRQRGWIR